MTPQAQLSIRSYAAAVSRHAHEFHQLILPVEGCLEIDIGGVDGRVDADGAALVVGGSVHGFRAEGANRFLILDLAGESGGIALPGRVLDRASGQPFFAVDPGLGHLVRYLAHALDAGGLAHGLAHRAIDLVVDGVMRARGAGPAVDAAVERAIALVHARFAEKLTLSMLAAAAGLSPSALTDRFRRATGRTPAAYLTEVRLDAAEDLLRRSRRPIAGIALAVGFSDQTALTRCLRRRRGITPAAARRAG